MDSSDHSSASSSSRSHDQPTTTATTTKVCSQMDDGDGDGVKGGDVKDEERIEVVPSVVAATATPRNSADFDRRRRELEEEIAVLKGQLSNLMARIASMEDSHAVKQSRMNELHVHEMEVVTRQHMDEAQELRRERDDLTIQNSLLNHQVHVLQEKLEGVSATAAYVTDIASSLEDIKDANESELEMFRSRAAADRAMLEGLLKESEDRELALEIRVTDLENQVASLKIANSKSSTLIEDLVAENQDLRQRLSASHQRKSSAFSLLSPIMPNIDERHLTDVNF